MKKNLLIFVLLIAANWLPAQEIIYTISSEYDQELLPLDSIHIQNLSNGSKISFTNLPVQDFYEINLSAISTGMVNLHHPTDYTVVKNIPGEITIKNNNDKSLDGNLSVIGISGQIIHKSLINHLTPNSSIKVLLGNEGVFFIRIETKNTTEVFKALGAARSDNNIDVRIIASGAISLKRAEVDDSSGFIYSLGDSLQIFVFRESYFAKPIGVKVNDSDSLYFHFSIRFIDSRDNTEYYYIKIGETYWMSRDLAYLPAVSPASSESITDSVYYVYDYDGTDADEAKISENYKTYGVLYNWPAALTACPDGWHLPTLEEWEQLAQFINNQKGPYTKIENNWNDVGKHLKATEGWRSDGNGTDDYGFSGIPGGYRNYNGTFYYTGGGGYWWTSTEYDSNIAWYLGLDYFKSILYQDNDYKENGFSVRCIRD